jgi:GNAT superfamily N-acetyltransferase
MKAEFATSDDVTEIANLGFQFWRQTQYGIDGLQYDPVKAERMAYHALENGAILVLRKDGAIIGFLLLVVSDLPFSDGRVAAELTFFVHPLHRGHGHLLIQAAEEFAVSASCDYVVLSTISGGTPERAERLYHSFGYKKTETVFSKRI